MPATTILSPDRLIIYCDGGARGNPGPAAIGYVAYRNADGTSLQEVFRYSGVIGSTTNNQAEYRALIAALRYAHTIRASILEVRLDSELVGKQMRGEYRVKDAFLKPLYAEAKTLERFFSSVTYSLIPRTLNKEADREVNRALDKAGT